MAFRRKETRPLAFACYLYTAGTKDIVPDKLLTCISCPLL